MKQIGTNPIMEARRPWLESNQALEAVMNFLVQGEGERRAFTQWPLRVF
jgi:hypothetical protein